MSELYHYSPMIEAEFVTRNGENFVARSFISYTSNRQMDQPASSASLVFKGLTWIGVSDDKRGTGSTLNGKSIDETIGFMDLCQIRMVDFAGKEWVDVNGVVIGVTEIEGESNGMPSDSVIVQIAGMGYLLEQLTLFFHNHLVGRSNLFGIGLLKRLGGSPPSGSPDEILRRFFDVFMSEDYKVSLPNGQKLRDAFLLKFEQIKNSYAIVAMNVLGAENDLWSLMKRYSDAPFNSMWLDVPQKAQAQSRLAREAGIPSLLEHFQGGGTDIVEAVHLEPTPYTLERWNTLAMEGTDRYFLYSPDEIYGEPELNRTTEGLGTFFWCSGKSLYSNFDQLSTIYQQSGGLIPIYHEEEIETLSLKRIEQSTEYVQLVNRKAGKNGVLTGKQKTQYRTGHTKVADLLVERTMNLAQWYGYPKGFRKGTIPLRGRVGWSVDDGARIGSILENIKTGEQFFITGISQSWSMGGFLVTTLTVDRGHDPDEYLAWWKKKQQGYKDVQKAKQEAGGIVEKIFDSMRL